VESPALQLRKKEGRREREICIGDVYRNICREKTTI